MDNDDDILKQFGGSIANDLNNALKIDGDKEDSERITFTHSPYIDINNFSSYKLPNKTNFNVLSINIQSVGAKFNTLLPFLTILDDNGLSIDVLNIVEIWLPEDGLSDPDNANLYKFPG